MYEAMLAAQEGVPLATIDRAAVDFGMPMGPIELTDVVGLDVAAHVGEIIAAELKRPVTRIARLSELIAAQRLGRKSGAGFYAWRDGKAVKSGEAPPAAGRPHRPPDPGPGQRVRRVPARRGGRGCGPRRCGGDLRHRLCAIPRRTSHLCARPGRRGDVVARLEELASASRVTLCAGCGLERTVGRRKSVTVVRRAKRPVLPSRPVWRSLGAPDIALVFERLDSI